MSEETPVGLAVAEKLLGIILIVLGAIIAYYSTELTEGDVSQLAGLFTAAGLIVAATGVFMLIAKHE